MPPLMLCALIADLVIVSLAAGMLIAVDPADAMSWVCRRFGFVPLTDAELADLTGLRPPPDAPGEAAAEPPPEIVPGGYVPLSPVPLARQIIARTVADGSPPWDTPTASFPAVTGQEER